MKLIKPSVEYIPQGEGLDGVNKQIERCGRICYKSEGRTTDTSAHDFVARMIKSNHLGMVEHGTIYLMMPVDHSNEEYNIFEERYIHNPYSKFILDNGIAYVTANYRILIENDWLDDLIFGVNATEHHAKRYTMKFTCARIDSQSITRYRTNSYAQESQRVINYLQEIRGAAVTFCEPVWVKPEDLEELKQDAAISEQLYFKWLNKGYKPEEARYFLINGTKTEIIVTAYEDDWRYFLDQRLRNTTGKPSSDMHHLAQLLWNEFKDKLNLEL